MKKSISNLTYALMCAGLLGAGAFTLHEAWTPDGLLAHSAEQQTAIANSDAKMAVARTAMREAAAMSESETIAELRAAHDRRINGEDEPARVIVMDGPTRTPFPVDASGPEMFHGSETGPVVSIDGAGTGWVQGDPIAFEQNFSTRMASRTSNVESAAQRDAKAARERIRRMGNKATPTANRTRTRSRSASDGLLALRQRLDSIGDRSFQRLEFVSRLRSQRAALRTYERRRDRANRTGTLRNR